MVDIEICITVKLFQVFLHSMHSGFEIITVANEGLVDHADSLHAIDR